MQWSFVPTMVIVGLPDVAVQEGRERVQAAIKNAPSAARKGHSPSRPISS